MSALVIAAIAVLYALFIIGRVLIFGIDTPGYASLLIAVLCMGAIQLLSLGIIGEYLGRLFLEVKGRPIYVVEGVYEDGADAGAEGLMDLKEEDILGADIGRHWYYRSKAAALRRWSVASRPQRLLDVGAGSGFFSRHLLAETGAQSALCVDIGYERDRDESVGGKPVLYRRDYRPDRLRPGADDGRAGACRRRSRAGAPLREQGAVRRAFPGDGAGLPLPVERPRRLPRAQAPLHAWARSKRPCASAGLAGRARRLLFRLRLSPRRGGPPGRRATRPSPAAA